jgi:hypothetical protein
LQKGDCKKESQRVGQARFSVEVSISVGKADHASRPDALPR